MKETIVIILIVTIYFVLTFLAYRKSFAVKPGFFYLGILLYFVISFIYFRVIFFSLDMIEKSGVKFDFGHAAEGLMSAMALSFFVAAGFIVTAILKRND